MSTRCFTMLVMVFAGVVGTARCKSATDSIVPQGPPPDPTLLPAATGQEPDTAAYKILNVAAQAAGFSYPDPVSRVRVWKVTSATVPLANTGAGHDYAEGGNEVSRAWGPNHDTHTIMILAFAGNSSHWLVDFTRGVGFSNYRRLTVQPDRDGCASFSNLVGQERILYIHNGGQLVRYNTATMKVENTGHFPLTVSTYAWLQQDRNDVWFAGLLTDNKTVWVWNSRTNQLLTHLETWTNEPYLERNGRYLIMTSGGPNTTTRVWDLSSNTFGAVQAAPDVQFHVSHAAIARGFVVALNPNGDAQERYDVVANTWAPMAPVPVNIYAPGSGVLGGKVFIFGGGNPSLGRAYALLLAERGANVVVNDIGELPAALGYPGIASAEAVAEEIRSRGGKAVADTHSVATEEGAAAIIQTALDGDLRSVDPISAAAADPKTMLQERLQATHQQAPQYSVIETLGPPHRRMFHVELKWNEGATRGTGPTIKAAEAAAAQAALEQMQNE